MKSILPGKRYLAAAIVLGLAGALISEGAQARGGRARIHLGFTFGAPLYWHNWYPPAYYPYYPYYPYYDYYRPPVVVVPATPPAPTVYVERDRVEEATQGRNSAAWWYFCRDANAYYPYVKTCPAGWERVSPQPPAN